MRNITLNSKLPKIGTTIVKAGKENKLIINRPKAISFKKEILETLRLLSPAKKSNYSPIKLTKMKTKRENGKRGSKVFSFSSDKRIFSEERKDKFSMMLSQEEIRKSEQIHFDMVNKVSQQIAAARETRFRFMSPGKLIGKLKASFDSNLLLSGEVNLKSLKSRKKPPNVFKFPNPLEDNPSSETYSVDSDSEEIIELQ
eukprot:CAMPEP_0205805942 /NCGR_PEP_ID=MMETSP0205-20121125/9303_1 /ASSEMBLY_ACC=CAM_ASM_000278 /TAXON_ID=36767 /ORGANISM="Euplotes focardii, Strain TN1" /LENGTH=198 /DNA_ID=CAMNT_0053077939 /DNA_START=82 /DNA_END=675 /DNA_ORIENTATION=-